MAQSQEGLMSGEGDYARFRQNPVLENITELLSQGGNADTKLSRAVDNLYVAWNQLLCNLLSKPGFQLPGSDHIKEIAEFSLKQLKDASQDLSREFVQSGLEWRISHPEEARVEDLKNYEDSIRRQGSLIDHITEVIHQKLGVNETVNTSDPPQ
uniref:Mediator complex subunit 10 n=1 Tax=Syphacia muris TaxID=451379 RepID=A0A0N5ATY9_9BILA